MAEIQNTAKFFSPLSLHLQKLGLELKCPFCLSLLNKPLLLPCNHIICRCCVPISVQPGGSECQCPACQNQFTVQDMRPVPYMENLVLIYQSLLSTFNSIMSRASSSSQALVPACIDTLKDDPSPPRSGVRKSATVCFASTNVDDHASLIACDEGGICSTRTVIEVALPIDIPNKELSQHSGHLLFNGFKATDEGIEAQELDIKPGSELPPESSPSSDCGKDCNHNSSASEMKCGSGEKFHAKMPAEHMLDTAGSNVHGSTPQGGNCYARDGKRQKMLDYSSYESCVNGNGHTQDKVLHFDNAKTSNCNLIGKLVDQPSHASREGSVCTFCHTSKLTDGTGPLLYYANGKEVDGEMITNVTNIVSVHSKCIEWSPRIYFEEDTIKNLESEMGRAAKLKCSGCGKKGAALGCFAKTCRRTYHVPCAFEIQDCRWDCEDFLMLCPSHNSFKFPREKFKSRKLVAGFKGSLSTEMIVDSNDFSATSPSGPTEWLFCGSALSSEEKLIMVKFAAKCDATVSKFWNPNVTHVIAATDEKGACTRTLKVLMGILSGRWILNMGLRSARKEHIKNPHYQRHKRIKACMEANRPVNEEPYEISLDNHGCLDGPKTGRLRVLNEEPKLFEGLKFYFSGEFLPAFKMDLVELVTTAGGAITENMERLIQTRNEPTPFTCLVVYNGDPPRGCSKGEESLIILQRKAEAQIIADQVNSSSVVQHTWILDSIAACVC